MEQKKYNKNNTCFKRVKRMLREYDHLYTYKSSKKIYLAKTSSKYLLIELKDEKKSLSLLSRQPVIVSKENGVLLFPK